MSQHPVGARANMIHYGPIISTGQPTATQTHLHSDPPCCALSSVLTLIHPRSPPEPRTHFRSLLLYQLVLCMRACVWGHVSLTTLL